MALKKKERNLLAMKLISQHSPSDPSFEIEEGKLHVSAR
jgi:hypothetical protein